MMLHRIRTTAMIDALIEMSRGVGIFLGVIVGGVIIYGVTRGVILTGSYILNMIYVIVVSAVATFVFSQYWSTFQNSVAVQRLFGILVLMLIILSITSTIRVKKIKESEST